MQLRITKDGGEIYAGVYDIADAESFARACADAWFRLRQQQIEKESSIGALMEHLDNSVLGQLNGACINLDKTER